MCRGPPYFVGIQFPQEWVGWRRDSRAWGWRSISPHLTADANASSSRLNYHVGWALVLRRDAHVARRREPAALGRSRPRKDGSMCASASAFFRFEGGNLGVWTYCTISVDPIAAEYPIHGGNEAMACPVYPSAGPFPQSLSLLRNWPRLWSVLADAVCTRTPQTAGGTCTLGTSAIRRAD